MTPAEATPKQLRQMEADNRRFPDHLVEIPREAWPVGLDGVRQRLGIIKVWRSRRFIVQVHRVSDEIVRLSVNRTEVTTGKREAEGRWTEGISWDDLQAIKRQCGYGNRDAVEVFPADRDVVDVANMRHVWVFLKAELPFKWKRS